MCVRVRKHKDPMKPVDRSYLTACVTRQARMSCWIDVACPYPLPDSKPSYYFGLGPHVIASVTGESRDVGSFQRRTEFRRTWRRLAGFDFLLGNQTALNQ